MPSDVPGARKITIQVEELKAQLERLPCESPWGADIVRNIERSEAQLRSEWWEA